MLSHVCTSRAHVCTQVEKRTVVTRCGERVHRREHRGGEAVPASQKLHGFRPLVPTPGPALSQTSAGNGADLLLAGSTTSAKTLISRKAVSTFPAGKSPPACKCCPTCLPHRHHQTRIPSVPSCCGMFTLLTLCHFGTRSSCDGLGSYTATSVTTNKHSA